MPNSVPFIHAAGLSDIRSSTIETCWQSGEQTIRCVFPLVEYRSWLAAEAAQIDEIMADRGAVIPLHRRGDPD